MSAIRQATAVLIAGRALLIEGPPGSGKSTLALKLIDRGAQLIGDDGVTLERRGAEVWAGPPPNTAGLIELRNVGLIRMPTVNGPVALILTLSPDAPRHRDQADTIELMGAAISHIPFDPAIPAAAIRAEHALDLYGLPRAEYV